MNLNDRFLRIMLWTLAVYGLGINIGSLQR